MISTTEIEGFREATTAAVGHRCGRRLVETVDSSGKFVLICFECCTVWATNIIAPNRPNTIAVRTLMKATEQLYAEASPPQRLKRCSRCKRSDVTFKGKNGYCVECMKIYAYEKRYRVTH
jgi:hypothetical protein